ncbi:hypothetical protein F4604DRAFT_1970301 [Suillus subluteus]|nr:hypothetical protein F4604DRAFT_1970301 [Suillus subluteus]
MASPSPSCSPSSSAVTILIPGKSVLKRPPPMQTGIFSRIKGYHISSINPPLTPALKDENREIEEREAERWRRVVRGNSIGPNETEDWWNLDKVESFYRKCCSSRAEESDPAISAAFKRPSGTNPRSVDLSGVQLTPTFAAILSDVFMIEWGLRKECELKIVLHALLILGTLVFLSVASNRRLKTPAFEVPGLYALKANSPRCLDLSQRNPDKKAVDYTAVSLTTVPEPGLTSLHLDYCSLRVPALDVAINVRTSSNFDQVWQPELFVIRPFATSLLRHKRINATGAVALALMIRDHPDVVPTTPNSSTFPSQGSIISSPPSSPIPPFAHPPPPSSVTRTGPVLPPPRLLSTMPPQTTYAPHGDVTTRHLAPNTVPQRSKGGLHPNGTAHRHDDRPSAALPDEVRALDALPRLGALRTLDLRGNDLRNEVTYLAQVLNLSENRLDVQCLMAKTSDISRNPYSGPGLEGSQPLRTAFTLNNALKGPFLSSTNTTSPGAIALAEFLPGSISLLHLDLTDNNLDIAAVMALSSGLKANHTMGCLDVNIPRDDEEFAECLVICTNNAEIESRAHTLLSLIENSVNTPRSISVASSGVSSQTLASPADQDLVQQAKCRLTDVILPEELLDLSDKLNSAVAQLSSAPSSRSLHFPDAIYENPADVSEDDTPLTPKVYKGKGRAEPEPGKVLSTTFMMTEDEVEDDNILLCEEDRISVPSPVVRSKSWVEEEGEIFQKGAVLLGPEEMEGECAGADLRLEVTSPLPGEPLRPPPLLHISRTRSTSSNRSTGDLHSPNSPASPAPPASPASRPCPGSFSASPPPEPR